MFHRHVWKVISQETRQSALAKAMMQALSDPNVEGEMRGPAGALRDREIVTYRCERCGTEKVRKI